jgi:hypothetical protein
VLGAGAALFGNAIARVVDEDAAHHHRGEPDELRAVGPVDLPLVDQPQVGFVHQRGGLQGVPGPLLTQVAARQSPQFVVDDRKQLVERSLIAAAPLDQQLRHAGRWTLLRHLFGWAMLAEDDANVNLFRVRQLTAELDRTRLCVHIATAMAAAGPPSDE